MNEEVDPRIVVLVRLAQRELNGDSPLSDEAGFARLEARLPRQGVPWSKRWLIGGVAVPLAGAVAVALLFFPPHKPALTFEVAGPALGEGGRIVAADRTRVRFSDGSEATLSSGTEARIQNLTEHGAQVVLTRGSMRVQIAKKPRASWTIAAGPYDVHVTGTAFDVSWSQETRAFDLRMETGAVIVAGPLADRGIPLKAGQHLFAGVATGRLTVDGGEATVAPSPSAVAAADSASATEPATERATEPRSEVEMTQLGAVSLPSTVISTPHARNGHSWARQVAEGHFNVVLEQAEQRGMERTLSGGSLEELAALADAARYAGRSAVAKSVLLAERQRFPGTGAAQAAAFFLGRIAEDSGAGGIEWYERYVSESPRGAYASQALGRKMMLLYKQRGIEVASSAAADYLSRYPRGHYAAAARKLAQEAQSAHKP